MGAFRIPAPAAGPGGGGRGRGRRGRVGHGGVRTAAVRRGLYPPGSQSQQASDLATRAFGRDTADVVVLYRSPSLTVRDPAYRAAVTRSLAALPTGKVSSYQTYWSTGSPQFVGRGGHETYAVLRLA